MGDLLPIPSGQSAELSLIDRLDAARKLLAELVAVEDVKLIRDQAQAAQQFMKQRDYSLQAQQHAAELKIRAERRLGELLAEMPKHNGDPWLHRATRLSTIGIEKTQSHRWQQIARLPEEAFEQHIQHTKEQNKELTTASVLRLAKEYAASLSEDQDEPSQKPVVKPFHWVDACREVREWLEQQKASWPENWQPMFCDMVRHLLLNLEKNHEHDRGQGAGSTQADSHADESARN